MVRYLIGIAQKGRIPVDLGSHHHGADAQFAGGAHHAQGDLAAVGHEELLDLLVGHDR